MESADLLSLTAKGSNVDGDLYFMNLQRKEAIVLVQLRNGRKRHILLLLGLEFMRMRSATQILSEIKLD